MDRKHKLHNAYANGENPTQKSGKKMIYDTSSKNFIASVMKDKDNYGNFAIFSSKYTPFFKKGKEYYLRSRKRLFFWLRLFLLILPVQMVFILLSGMGVIDLRWEAIVLSVIINFMAIIGLLIARENANNNINSPVFKKPNAHMIMFENALVLETDDTENYQYKKYKYGDIKNISENRSAEILPWWSKKKKLDTKDPRAKLVYVVTLQFFDNTEVEFTFNSVEDKYQIFKDNLIDLNKNDHVLTG